MGFQLKRLSIENFKYISRVQITDFGDTDIIILDGPNGYGKSTLFDAIELLITGNIRHFKEDILNNRHVSKSVLSNSNQKNTVFEGIFFGVDGEQFTVRREFDQSNSFKDTIYFKKNDYLQKVTQKELYEKLNIDENIYHIAAYISQSESLDFLQQKYKDRKTKLSGVLDDRRASENVENIKAVKVAFRNKISQEMDSWTVEEAKISERIEQLKVNLKQFNNIQKSLPYNKMFEKDWEFDREQINVTKDFSVLTAPLLQLQEFTSNYKAFMDYNFNLQIQSMMNFPKDVYRAIYFRREILNLRQRKSEVEQLIQLASYRDQLIAGNKNTNKVLFNYLNVTIETNNKIEFLEKQCAILAKQLDESQTVLNDLIEKRVKLLVSLKQAEQSSVWPHNKCPLCGFESEVITELFDKTSNAIQIGIKEFVKQLQERKKQLEDLYQNDIIKAANDRLKSNEYLLTLYKNLNQISELSTMQLEIILKELNVVDFCSKSTILDLDQFERSYQDLFASIKSILRPVEVTISSQKYAQYKTIFENYYNNQEPQHTAKDLDEKYKYITEQYANTYLTQLVDECQLLEHVQNKHAAQKTKMDNAMKSLTQLSQKYCDAYKEYQTSIANGIKVPLFLYSGRIIQNYPLGLGVIAHVEDNQIVFKVGNKECDAFNILSTGQLNGVMLSILLSVRNTFKNQIGLDMLLIDDPLQSIDDISAYSFADLLSAQFGHLKIIISTHEDDKADLFRYKFRQRERETKTLNMQEIYLNN